MYTTYGTASATKVDFRLFSLFTLASSVKNPKYQTNTNVKFTEQVANQFHEVNALYDGTINKIHHLFYSTNKTKNETFTFHESMKQEDIFSFVDKIEK